LSPFAIIDAAGRVLLFDAVERVTHSSSVTVTSHPTEPGATVSDNATVDPVTLSATALITASPFAGALVGDALPAAGVARLSAAEAWLDSVAGQIVTIQTARRSYAGMVLTRWRRADTSRRALRFEIDAKQILVATVTTVDLPAPDPAPAVEASSSAAVDAGDQPTTDTATDSATGATSATATAEEEADTSAAASIYDAVVGD
jgi:hypothetical protein